MYSSLLLTDVVFEEFEEVAVDEADEDDDELDEVIEVDESPLSTETVVVIGANEVVLSVVTAKCRLVPAEDYTFAWGVREESSIRAGVGR